MGFHGAELAASLQFKRLNFELLPCLQSIGKIYLKYISKIFKIKYIIIHFKVEKRKIIYLNIFQKYIQIYLAYYYTITITTTPS